MITTIRAPASSKISEVHEVVLKHRPANISLHPSIHPSQLLLDPLLALIHIEITKASLLGGLSPMPWQSANVNPSMLLLLPLKSSLKVLVPTAAADCFLPANFTAALMDTTAKSIFNMLLSGVHFYTFVRVTGSLLLQRTRCPHVLHI